jgi:hypothetical protein
VFPSPAGPGSEAGALSDAGEPVTAATAAVAMRLTLLTARLTGPAFRFLAAAFFFAGRALRAFTARVERAVFRADFFAPFFAERLAPFFAFLAAFFLATRLAILTFPSDQPGTVIVPNAVCLSQFNARFGQAA